MGDGRCGGLFAHIDMDTKLTYDQLEFRIKQRELELLSAQRTIKERNEELRRERLILLGMVTEQFHLRVNISPDMLTHSVFELAQTLLDQCSKRTAYEIEEKLGGPLRRLQEALMHIHYLENHATSRGLPFTPFEQRASDKWLYY
jgi:hypothetical protein